MRILLLFLALYLPDLGNCKRPDTVLGVPVTWVLKNPMYQTLELQPLEMAVTDCLGRDTFIYPDFLTLEVVPAPWKISAGPFSAQWQPSASNSRRYTLNRPVLWVGIGSAFASGAAWGLHQKTAHHWNEFHARFPNANPKYWNPAESWKNKWVNGDPAQGRTAWDLGPVSVTKPVHLTDAAHPLASANIGFAFAGGICLGYELRNPRPWWHYGLDAVLVFGARSAGNYLTFNLLYK